MKAKRPNLQERKKAYLISNAGKLSALTKSQVMSRDAVSRMFAESVRQHMKPVEYDDLPATKRAKAAALAADLATEKARKRAAAKDRKRARTLAYYRANKDKLMPIMRAKAQAWYHANRDTVKQRRTSPEGRQKINDYNKTEAVREVLRLRASMPRNKIIRNQRTRLRQFIKQTGSHVHLRFGCSPDFMRAHIQRQFTKGMTWDNYGEWHIDHIMPCAQFDLSNQMHADICFNWQNLRPLWAKENHMKSDTITHPQLCLPIVV